MNYFLLALKKYADFNGRATRSEFWFFVLFLYIFLFVFALIDLGISSVFSLDWFYVLSGVFLLATIIPSLSISVRRLHDTGNSGFMLFLKLIPFIGEIWVLVLMILDSEPKDNKYGKKVKK